MSFFSVCFVLIACILHLTLGQYDKICNPMNYGAVGDGETDDTKAIQKAMDDCYLNNDKGGLVSLPSSKSFLSFALNITSASNIGLEIQSSSTLIISNNRTAWPGTEDFLHFTSCSNIKIFGGGLINGQGLVWWQNAKEDFRPETISTTHCYNLLITNITIRDPPSHCMEIDANNTEISHVTVLAPPSTGIPDDQQSYNTDAVDVHGSPFWIHDCYFSTGDDNVAVHANDTLIENCYFGTGHGASIKSSGGWYKNITFNNIQFNGTSNGIRIKVNNNASEGKMWEVYYTNLDMNYVYNSIIITEFYHGTNETQSDFWIDGVYIENVTSKNSETAGQFECQDASPCHHIELNNVHISASQNGGQFVCKKAYGNATNTEPQSCLLPE